MTFGLIGAGRWAEVHRDALQQLGERLECVLVSSQASKARVERDWGVRATTDPQQFLGYGSEAVIVASPNYLHAEHAILCLDAGKHVLVEKPMATTLEACDQMLAAARRSAKVLAVGLEMRVFGLFAKVKALLEEGAIGAPLHLRLDLWRRPYRSGAGGWKEDPVKLGSSILEEPVHYLDLARWYFLDTHGEPHTLHAWATSRTGHEAEWQNLDVRLEWGGMGSRDSVDSKDSRLRSDRYRSDRSRSDMDSRYRSDAAALVSRSIAAYGHHVYLELVGETGALRASWEGKHDLDPAPKQELWLHNSGDRDAYAERIALPPSGHAFDLPKQTQAFIQAIRGERAPAASGEDGRASVALCLAAEASLRTRWPQSLSY